MSIPKFAEVIKPFLLSVRDGNEHSMKELKNSLARYFDLSENELSELLPSGRQEVFVNRLYWAGTYLTKAGLTQKPSRGTFVITQEGKKVISENPDIIDADYLSRYESFRIFRSSSSGNLSASNLNQNAATPDDTFEDAFKKINQNLADDLLIEVMKLSETAFEQMVIDLLKSMGYGAFNNSGRTTPITGDEGIDGVIMEDKLGFDLIYIQAKKWNVESSVGRPEIQKFVGAIAGRGGKGLFVTTAKYSKQAKSYASLQHIVLIDGAKLTELMIEHNFGVSVKKAFEIKAIDSDVFNDYLEE